MNSWERDYGHIYHKSNRRQRALIWSFACGLVLYLLVMVALAYWVS